MSNTDTLTHSAPSQRHSLPRAEVLTVASIAAVLGMIILYGVAPPLNRHEHAAPALASRRTHRRQRIRCGARDCTSRFYCSNYSGSRGP
jgi:hypothetical protein